MNIKTVASNEPTPFTEEDLPKFSLITAITKEFGIGYKGDLPWVNTPIYTDMMFYEKVTSFLDLNKTLFNSLEDVDLDSPKSVVIMGRISWESVPFKYRPFKRRINIIVTRNKDLKIDMKEESLRKFTHIVNYFEEALLLAKKLVKDGSIFVIGGSQLYKQAIDHMNCENMFITELIDHRELPCDTFFPSFHHIKSWKKKNITKEAIIWLNTFKSKRNLPNIELDPITSEPSILENDIRYRFTLYQRH